MKFRVRLCFKRTDGETESCALAIAISCIMPPTAVEPFWEVFKILGTISISVLLSAWLSWKNSSKGRKEDILIKEKYKMFEQTQKIVEEIDASFMSLSHHRDVVLRNWIDNVNTGFDGQPLTEADKWNLLMELRNESADFQSKNLTKLFNFKFELLYPRDIVLRMDYMSRVLRDYASDTFKMTLFIEESMRNIPNNIDAIKKQKFEEWRTDGPSEVGSAIHTFQIAMFYDLGLPSERFYKPPSLDRLKKTFKK